MKLKKSSLALALAVASLAFSLPATAAIIPVDAVRDSGEAAARGGLQPDQQDPGAQLKQNTQHALNQQTEQRLEGEMRRRRAMRGAGGPPPNAAPRPEGAPPQAAAPNPQGGPPPDAAQRPQSAPPPNAMQRPAGAPPPNMAQRPMGSPPPTDFGYVQIDTNGTHTTGLWRYGLGYINTNLTKSDDVLVLGGFTSLGTSCGHINYSVPLAKGGPRLGLGYSANVSEVKRGSMSDAGIKSGASLWGLNLTQTLVDKPALKLDAFLAYDQLDTRSEMYGFVPPPPPTHIISVRWLDEKINHWQGGLRFTHYGKDAALYHEHTVAFSDWSSQYDRGKHYTTYQLNLIGKKMLPHNQMLTLRALMQLTGDDYISSADQFFIGGYTSVRGYKENVLNGERGYTLNLEYSVPQDRRGEWVWFLDYGRVSGPSVTGENNLFSYGAGYRHRFGRDIFASLLFGIPADKHVNGQEQGNVRAHFVLYGRF